MDLAPQADSTKPDRAEAPQHGTVQQFWLGCRCLPCRGARARYRTADEARTLYAVPGPEVQAHIESLRQAGMGLQFIARQANVSKATVRRIMKGQTVWRDRLDRVAAVQQAIADAHLVPSFRYRRMIEYLLGEEYTHEQLERYFGTKLRLGRRITWRTACRIEKLFRRLTE